MLEAHAEKILIGLVGALLLTAVLSLLQLPVIRAQIKTIIDSVLDLKADNHKYHAKLEGKIDTLDEKVDSTSERVAKVEAVVDKDC